MDFTEQNLETINNLRLYNMTTEELVDSFSKLGTRFHYSHGVWWREVRQFFYQPVPFIKQIIPHQSRPKFFKALGGYYHAVPDGAFANGIITVNEIMNQGNYELEILKKKVRYEIRKGLQQVRIRRIDKLEDLLNDGYQVYLDWETRVKNISAVSQGFHLWINEVFQHPYVLILGGYFEGKLIAFIIAYAVDGIAELSKSFSHSSFHHLYVDSALNYSYVRICQNNPDILKICNGLRFHKTSLEIYKAKFGYHHQSYPAYIYLRPLIRPIVRRLMPIQYNRLMGHYNSDEINDGRDLTDS